MKKKINKKLTLNKKTVANLLDKEQNDIRAGAYNSIKTCRITDGCDTVHQICTDPILCVCSALCTIPCPLTFGYECDTYYC